MATLTKQTTINEFLDTATVLRTLPDGKVLISVDGDVLARLQAATGH